MLHFVIPRLQLDTDVRAVILATALCLKFPRARMTMVRSMPICHTVQYSSKLAISVAHLI